jgi:TonB family protein
MLRLFAPPTREPVLSRNPLTVATLLLHLAGLGALLFPLRRIVTTPLLDRELVYLVPPDQEDAPEREHGMATFEAAPAAAGVFGREAVPALPGEEIVGRGNTPDITAAELDAAQASQRKVEVAVTELDVDSAVVRDPSSAAPSYPPSLEAKGITGFAQVRFVVDTLGVVDTLSYRVIVATHDDFAVAIRRALPRMRFRPAIQRGHRVRQWVEQTFHFRLVPRDTTSLPSVGVS